MRLPFMRLPGGTSRNRTADRARLAAVLAASAFLASCWHPAFDPEISGSEAVIRKLGAPVLRFTAEGVQGWEMEDAWFVPVAADLSTLSGWFGLLVRPVDNLVRFNPVWFDAAASQGNPDMFNSNEFLNRFGTEYSVLMAPNGTTRAFAIGHPEEGRSISPLSPPTTTVVNYPASVATLGVGFSNDPGAGMTSTFTWIGIDPAFLPRYMPPVVWTGLGDPVFGAPAPLQFPDYLLVASRGKAFFPAATGSLYLSCGLSDGSRAIYRWTNPSTQNPIRYPEVYGPLVGALSDGRLLAEKDGILTVLDPNLKRLFFFPAGKLRFVHERWDGVEMLSVFTRTIYVRTESGDDVGRLDVEVYEIPTADLSKLAE